MADVFFKCPACDGQLVVDERGAGMNLPCPYCEESVTIPHSEAVKESPENVNGEAPVVSEPVTASPPEPERPADTSPMSVSQASAPSLGEDPLPPPTPSAETKGEAEDLLEDLEWPDEEGEKALPSDEEIQRLAAMMNPDEVAVAAEDGSKGKSISFRCSSCGQVLSAKRAQAGDRVNCTQCQAELTVPAFRHEDTSIPKPRKAALPSGRNRMLRTADDMRKGRPGNRPAETPAPAANPSGAVDASSSVMSELDPEVQRLLLRELQRLQAQKQRERQGQATQTAGEKTEAPSPAPQQPPSQRVEPRELPQRKATAAPRRKPLPPLAQHAEVISSDEDAEVPPAETTPSPRPSTRTRPTNDALPPLVTMESMDLDSEVARQWGEQAVVPTRTLNWVAMTAIVGLAAACGFFGYQFFGDTFTSPDPPPGMSSPSAAEQGTSPTQNSQDAKAHPEVVAAFEAFRKTTDVIEKATFVRNEAALATTMESYYKMFPIFDRQSVNVESLITKRRRIGDLTFITLTGEYERTLEPILAHFEETSEGQFLLDWKSWTGFSDPALEDFRANGSDGPLEFRVLVKEATFHQYNFEDASKYQCYQLRDKNERGRVYGYTEAGTPVAEALVAFFRDRDGSDRSKEQRLTLKLEFASEFDQSKGQAMIRNLVRTDWIDVSQTTP